MPAVKMEFFVPSFWSIPTKKLKVESEPFTGRTYFTFGGQIVAVAKPIQEVRQ